MPGVDRPKLPSNWVRQNGRVYCLACQRERAAERGLAKLPKDASFTSREQQRAAACIAFEFKRDPDRQDGEIAKACRTSIPTVRKARAELGVSSPAN